MLDCWDYIPHKSNFLTPAMPPATAVKAHRYLVARTEPCCKNPLSENYWNSAGFQAPSFRWGLLTIFGTPAGSRTRRKTGFEAAAYANSATGAWYVAHENRRQLHDLILQRISHFIAVFMIVLYHILMQICSEYKYDSQTINI